MSATTAHSTHEQPHASSSLGLLVAATGVVYGDIGTTAWSTATSAPARCTP